MATETKTGYTGREISINHYCPLRDSGKTNSDRRVFKKTIRARRKEPFIRFADITGLEGFLPGNLSSFSLFEEPLHIDYIIKSVS